jgi:hypothetical protein
MYSDGAGSRLIFRLKLEVGFEEGERGEDLGIRQIGSREGSG